VNPNVNGLSEVADLAVLLLVHAQFTAVSVALLAVTVFDPIAALLADNPVVDPTLIVIV